MPEGRIKWYSHELGHGFIIWEDKFGDVFVRSEEIKDSDHLSLDVGDKVTFEVVAGAQGEEAKNVSKVS